MRADDEEADDLAVELLQHVADGEEVAQRLGHLLAIDLHEAVVQPVAHEALATLGEIGGVALGNLVLVVRELQVGPAAVDVELPAQQLGGHGRALQVPARAPRTEGPLPAGLGRFLGLGSLPEHEVERIFLAGSHGHALAGTQVVERLAAQAAVAGKAPDPKERVPVATAVGVAVLFQQAHQIQHLRHVVGGTRLQVRALDAERGLVLMHGGNEAAGEAGERLAVLDGTTDDLVVDVGDVAHVGDLVATRAQPALHHVEGHQHPRMADVAVVVDRHAADIQPHPPRFEGLEVFLATGQGVVELERPGHGGSTVGNGKRDEKGGHDRRRHREHAVPCPGRAGESLWPPHLWRTPQAPAGLQGQMHMPPAARSRMPH